MKKINEAPAPLKHKMFLTVIIGILDLLIGVAVYLFSKDRTMLLLSGIVCVLSILRAWSILSTITGKQYETVEGTCVGIMPKPLRKYRKIRIMDDDGNESAVLLNKQTKVKIGYRYRFFFQKIQRFSLGSEYLDTAMSSNHFLGYEELGELNNPTEQSNE